MFDAEDPGKVFNEFFLTLFLPGIAVFVAVWAVFRLLLNDLLLAYGLAPIVPRSGAGAVSGGYGRFVLAVLLTAALVSIHVGVYRRVLRRPLRDRGIV